MALVPYITTTDNPYHPANEFEDWYRFDLDHGYNTLSLLARLYTGGDHQSPKDNELAREAAIDEMVKENVTGRFRKIYVDEPDTLTTLGS